MKIEPTLLSQCADAGAKAAAAHLTNGDGLLVINTTNVSERRAREAFALPTIDIGLMPLGMFVGMHPDVQEGELFSDACLRLIKERDGMELRLAQLEWRPVSETPDNWWTSHLLGLRREGAEHLSVTVDLWWSTATDEEKQDAARAGREGGAE